MKSGCRIKFRVLQSDFSQDCSSGKSFDITYVRLKFISPRPESFSIYKKTTSDDDWEPWQFYRYHTTHMFFRCLLALCKKFIKLLSSIFFLFPISSICRLTSKLYFLSTTLFLHRLLLLRVVAKIVTSSIEWFLPRDLRTARQSTDSARQRSRRPVHEGVFRHFSHHRRQHRLLHTRGQTVRTCLRR